VRRVFDLVPPVLMAIALFLPAGVDGGPIAALAMCGAGATRDLFGVRISCIDISWAGEPITLSLALAAIIAGAARCFIANHLARNIAAVVALLAAMAAALRIPFMVPSGPEWIHFEFGMWIFIIAIAILAAQALRDLSRTKADRWWERIIVAAIFGLCLLFFWQIVVVGFGIKRILLPPPSEAGHELIAQAGALWADFQQTFMKAVLAGFAIGSGLGLAVAVLTDRVPFLQRGLLPLGNMASAVPIIGIAPIMVMMFGFDWQSKAAVIVVMTFFPMLINAIAGLAAADHMQRDLMRSYGAGYWQTLTKLRLPAALPFIFNALKINSTLALIGGIVAEFFGSHTVGLGFRINTMAGRNDFAVVWATIAVAALAGSMFYGLLALIERGLTFWHPSYRAKAHNR
jgi:NitT/TauT family transport system permease protein